MAGPIQRLWRNFGLAVVCLLGLTLAIGFVLPSEWHAEGQVVVEIDSPNPALAYLVDPLRWPEWTVWNSRDIPGFAVKPGKRQADGSRTAVWTAESLERVEVTVAPPEGTGNHRTVKYRLHFGDGHDTTLHGQFDLSRVDHGWRITWTVHGPLKRDPISRWAGLLIVRWMAANDLRDGLQVLEEQLERNGGQ